MTNKYIFESNSKAVRQLNEHTKIPVCYQKCSSLFSLAIYHHPPVIRLFAHYSTCRVIKEPLLSFVCTTIIPLLESLKLIASVKKILSENVKFTPLHKIIIFNRVKNQCPLFALSDLDQNYILSLFCTVLCQAHRGVEEIVLDDNCDASCACKQGTFAKD